MRRGAFLAVLLILALLAGFLGYNGWRLESRTQEPAPAEEEPPELHMLDVGQGLCVLIRAGGQTLLYDGGGRDASSFVVSYLKQQGIERLDYMVASHYDEDHISGLVGVLRTIPVNTVLTADYQVDTKIYSSFRSALARSGAAELHPGPGDTFPLGSGAFEVLGPENYTAEAENDRSVVIRAAWGDRSCLLTGDAEANEELALVTSGRTLESEIYVAGHHGSSRSSGEMLLTAVSPAYALISCGRDNSYGHPAEETLSRLEKAGAMIYRTDTQGTVIALGTGAGWQFTATGVTGAGNEQPAPETAISPDITYVINENSGKFHLPTCESAAKIAPYNRRDTTESREELIDQGYTPCGACKP